MEKNVTILRISVNIQWLESYRSDCKVLLLLLREWSCDLKKVYENVVFRKLDHILF